jgi:hypothetical protein
MEKNLSYLRTSVQGKKIEKGKDKEEHHTEGERETR